MTWMPVSLFELQGSPICVCWEYNAHQIAWGCLHHSTGKLSGFLSVYWTPQSPHSQISLSFCSIQPQWRMSTLASVWGCTWLPEEVHPQGRCAWRLEWGLLWCESVPACSMTTLCWGRRWWQCGRAVDHQGWSSEFGGWLLSVTESPSHESECK